MSAVEFFEFVDRAASTVRKTEDGYLVADARIARTGVQSYLGTELGKPDMQTVRLYRPEDEVFAADTLASFAHRPLTNNHPPEGKVDAKTWKKYAVGVTDGGVVRDGGFVRIPMMLTDADAIAAFEAGKRELSAGYTAIIDWTPGVTPDGEAFDAVQRRIRGNHVALVDKARAGPDCRIGDADRNRRQQKEDKPMPELRKVIVDGLTIEVTEQGAEAIAKLQKVIADTAQKTETSMTALKTALADAESKVQKQSGELDALKGAHAAELKTLGDKLAAAEAGIEAKIEERQAVIADAAKIAGKAVDGKGKSVAEIRRDAVAVKLGDAAVKDKSDDYVTAAFDVLAGQVKAPAKDALGNMIADAAGARNSGDVVNMADAMAVREAAHQRMIARLNGTDQAKS